MLASAARRLTNNCRVFQLVSWPTTIYHSTWSNWPATWRDRVDYCCSCGAMHQNNNDSGQVDTALCDHGKSGCFGGFPRIRPPMLWNASDTHARQDSTHARQFEQNALIKTCWL